MCLEVRLDSIRQRIALRSIQDTRKVRHDFRVGVHAGKGVAVGGTPGAKEQA